MSGKIELYKMKKNSEPEFDKLLDTEYARARVAIDENNNHSKILPSIIMELIKGGYPIISIYDHDALFKTEGFSDSRQMRGFQFNEINSIWLRDNNVITLGQMTYYKKPYVGLELMKRSGKTIDYAAKDILSEILSNSFKAYTRDETYPIYVVSDVVKLK